MSSKAQTFEQLGNERYCELNVGDTVIASYDKGSQFVVCRIYAIEETTVKFLWGQVVFSADKEQAAMSTVLVEKFNRESVIAEIKAMLLAA